MNTENDNENPTAPTTDVADTTTALVVAEDQPTTKPALDGVMVHDIVPELRLVASDPQALSIEQSRLTSWARAKVAEATVEVNDLTENVEIHKRNKWSSSALVRALKRAEQRVTFYDKLASALEAGFHIIPNMPCDVFAIRTDRKNPTGGGSSTGESDWQLRQAVRNVPAQQARALPAGEGEYKNPQALVSFSSYKDDKGMQQNNAWASEFATELEFPFSLARPEVLTATQHAMAMKVFDELAAVPATGQSWDRATRRGDPMIVGRIRKPWVGRQRNGGADHVTFLVVWFLDTTML